VGFFPKSWLDIQRIEVSSGNRVEKQVVGVAKPKSSLRGYGKRCDSAVQGQNGDGVEEVSKPSLVCQRKLPKFHCRVTQERVCQLEDKKGSSSQFLYSLIGANSAQQGAKRFAEVYRGVC
jgi:hypothetical protein